MVTETDANLVSAAAAGDPAALERLVSDYLPLVYNIVGRALPVAADVDDVVQETMLRVVRGLPTLRDPRMFRSWLVAVAMNQVRDHVRAYSGRPRPLDEAPELADPGADFADLTLTELGLTGQRREVAMATAWLDDDDRELLSLWWLVEAGHLTRGDLVDAIGLEPHHVTVRIARMKAQLETSRAVVRALCAVPICLELSELAMQWHGRPEPLWRKRFARHTRQCPFCAGMATDFVPAERLLVRLPLVPVPFGLADVLHHTVVIHPTAATAQLPIPGARGPRSAAHSHRRIPKAGARSAASHFAAKAAIAAAATAAVVGAVVVTTGAGDAKNDSQAGGAASSVTTASGSTASSAIVSPTPSDSSSADSVSSSSVASSSRPGSAKPTSSPTKSSMKPPAQSSASSSLSQSSDSAPASAPSTTPSSASSAGSSSQADPADQVLAVINQARAGQGLPPLTRSSGLDKSAAAHTSTMASGCGLSHQCPGEPGLGDRETAAGVSWTSAGENIGDGGPVSNTNAAIASMAVGLTNSMLAEQPPNDGHRKNILSSGFHHIGISVFRDSSGTVWMTQDFSD
ncbi:sigma-70 family RNA polymerase sigma factor [Catenulispora sp. NL8]|uniref:Sigma-70 family RNA polymerase sigma factor n=1 Tax=Catenulispora pinistramenti TaxID=2705254 RepID=A0ABS5L1Q6_9ACTN|nr:sigma-70 family RNA polymerase sigma factor [Catenulispora pinistramenti]MBS2552248.1 sigma-70 family RNA polymerase sigma factor [Catenulispora pinistramenti]